MDAVVMLRKVGLDLKLAIFFGCNCETYCYNGRCGYCARCGVTFRFAVKAFNVALQNGNLECCGSGCRRRRRSFQDMILETGSISPVMNRFMTIDQDGNGVIDGNETMIMFKEEHTNKDLYEIENMLKEIDHNGNGVIEPAEFDHDLK